MTDKDKIKAIQTAIGVTADGAFGPVSQAALDALIHPELVAVDPGFHAVRASTFADPADIAAFKKAKSAGLSDQQAFKVGDNGVGKWGDDCSQGAGPMVALPPEDWKGLKVPRLAAVEVTANGRTVIAKLGDTMPARANITNGCGIDLNPDACQALGLKPPTLVPAKWRFCMIAR